MPNTIIVAFDFKGKESVSFKKLPFETQLSLIRNKIEMACDKLSTLDADNWIIAWQEYGLSNPLGEHGERYISLEQKKNLKKLLSELSLIYPKLTLIGGSVASVREIDVKKQPEKVSKVKALTRANFFEENPKPFVIRNTAYIAKGGIITRHDKTKASAFELSQFNPSALGIFRPGQGNKGEKAKIDGLMGIEICLEHAMGVLGSEVSNKTPPWIQFILSAWINIWPRYCISPYLIHIDSNEDMQIITQGSKEQVDVTLYSCGVSSKSFELTKITPISLQAYIFSQILNRLPRDGKSMRYPAIGYSIKEYIRVECKLKAVDCSELISFITAEYRLNQCGKLPFRTIRKLISFLVSLHPVSNLSLDSETSKYLIELASHPRPKQTFIERIKAIPLHEVADSKQKTAICEHKM